MRALRRVRAVAMASAVVAGVVGVGVGLRALIDGPTGSRIGSPVSGAPSTPSFEPLDPVTLCGASSSIADLDGDGADDRVVIGVPEPEPGAGCDHIELDEYVARIDMDVGADGAATYSQRLEECRVRGQCWVLATPDLNSDGRAEVAIEHTSGASTLNFSLYRFDVDAADGPLRRLELAPPGDPFDETFGLSPGATTFLWYGSVTHLHWLSCPQDPGLFAVVTALREEAGPDVSNVHSTLLRLEGDALVVSSTRDEPVRDGSIEYPPDMCGSAMNPFPDRDDELTL